jgi:hypothetical protein
MACRGRRGVVCVHVWWSDPAIVRVDEGESSVSVGIDPEASVGDKTVVLLAQQDQIRHIGRATVFPS